MRSPWSFFAVLGLALPFVAAAADNPYLVRTNIRPMATLPFPHGTVPGHGDHEHGRGDHHHFRGAPFLYVPTYASDAPSDDRDEDRGPAEVRTEYVPVPYPVPVAPEAPPAPPRPAPIVRYATTGQHIDIPKGAHVTTGSVYKYKQGGVNVYTNVPPPDAARATLLFGYTEAVAPASSTSE